MSEPTYPSGHPQPAGAPVPQQPPYQQVPAQPYGQVPQQPYLAAPPPKKSKAGLWITLAVVLLLVCGGTAVGLVVFFNKKVQPTVDSVVAAQKTTVVAPDQLAGRKKVTDAQLQSLADTMKTGVQGTIKGSTGAVAGFYGDAEKQDLVMIFAVSAAITNPEKELNDSFASMGTSGLKATDLQDVDAGPLGGKARCGAAEAQGVPMAVCAWVDNGSLGMVVWYYKTVNEVKAEFITVRGQIEKKS
jgi:hypothetical protein